MNMIRLIAWREYMENVKTKGFWAGILIFPIILAGMYFLQTTLSNSTPTRYYIFINQSGEYGEAVEDGDRERSSAANSRRVRKLSDRESRRCRSGINGGRGRKRCGPAQLIEGADTDEGGGTGSVAR